MASPAELVLAIARVGREHPAAPRISCVEPFEHFFDRTSGYLDASALDRHDGCCSRREVLARFLLLMAVLDQGPDIEGLRQMLINMTEILYRKEIRFLHRPAALFREIGIVVSKLVATHETIKSARAEVWARENQTKEERYNLLQYDNNQTKPLHYIVARWGVPLLLPLFLTEDPSPQFDFQQNDNPSVLIDYLEHWPSAEQMSRQLKSHDRYGLGKAIGDKACHLFTKWFVSTFRLARRNGCGWSDFAYEVPYDSNAGRVLWRTGYLLHWADESAYTKRGVLRPGAGKGGTTYIRVTNIRGMGSERPLSEDEKALHAEICTAYLQTHKVTPRRTQIQHLQHIYLLKHTREHSDDPLTVAHFDDGLIYIGTQFCLNHADPRCDKCPIQTLCEGYQQQRRLITDFRT